MDIAEPQPLPPRQKRRRPLLRVLIGLTAVILLGAAGTFVAVTSNTQAAEAEAQARTSASASSKAAASQSAEATRLAGLAKAKAETDRKAAAAAAAAAKALKEAPAKDRAAMEQAGWEYVADYLYYVVPEGTRCGSTRCVVMGVTTNMPPDGCPRGLSVSVSFLSAGEVSVNSSSRTTGALHIGEQARLEFRDLSGLGETFRVDSMRCY